MLGTTQQPAVKKPGQMRERERERERERCGIPMCCTIKEMNDTENLFLSRFNEPNISASQASDSNSHLYHG